MEVNASTLDSCVENAIISTTHAYAFAKMYKSLTIMVGATNQFPLYESVIVVTLECLFTWMRVQGVVPEELSPVERGYKRWGRLGGVVRSFTVIGICAASCILCYHLPLNWLGVIGTSEGYLPDYMRPEGWVMRGRACVNHLSSGRQCPILDNLPVVIALKPFVSATLY